MNYATLRDGVPVELFPGASFVDASDIQRPANWLDLATPEDRAEAGILDVVEPPAPPSGKVVTITGLAVQDGAVVRTYTLADAPAPVVPVPYSVHAYQIAGQAAAEGIITVDEGRAWAGAGVVPPSLQAAVDKLVTDPVAHDRVTFFLVGATDFPRDHPNTIALGGVFGKDAAGLDAFFVAAGAR